MNTTILEEAQNFKVRFHIGRGGQFHNAGYKTYEGTVNGLSDCFGDAFVISEDENEKLCLIASGSWWMAAEMLSFLDVTRLRARRASWIGMASTIPTSFAICRSVTMTSTR